MVNSGLNLILLKVVFPPYLYLLLSIPHHHFIVEILKLLASDQEHYLQAFSVSTRAFILIFDIRPRFEKNGKL